MSTVNINLRAYGSALSPHEIIRGETAVLHGQYRGIQNRLAALTLVDVFFQVIDEHPGAKYVGLGDGDQDTTGYQWALSIVDGDGKLITEETPCLDDTTLSDLDDRNRDVWEPFTFLKGAAGPVFGGDVTGVERFLDLHLVAASLVQLVNQAPR